MPKPLHLDDKLYVNMVLLLLVFGFACLFVVVVFFMAFIVHGICPVFARVVCASRDSPFLTRELHACDWSIPVNFFSILGF